jgi:hypothetical protein
MEEIIKEIKWFVDYVCYSVPMNYREDVKQDIYLQLCLDLADRDDLLFEEKLEEAFKVISKYKKRYSYRYKRQKEISFESIDTFARAPEEPGYRLSYDIDKIFNNIKSKNQIKLLRFILENGIDVTYEEIADELGYKSKTQPMWTLRSLLQNMKDILNGDGISAYNHKERYLRYRIKK